MEVELDGSHIQVEAALSEELPVSVLLGTDVPELTHLISGTGSSINLVSQEQVMVVMTRAKAKQQLEEELIRKKKELLSGAQSNTLVRVNEPVACDNVVPSRSESEAGQAEQQSPRKNSKLTKDQRREIRKKAQETEKSREGGNSEYPDITIEDLKKLQAEDPTLAEVLRAADRSANDGNESVAEYFRREGLVYRRWTPKGRSSTFQVEQLVLPKRCRGTVLKLAHDVPLGGHLGKEKTGCRLLRRFYWPTLFKDVAEFCRGCPTCQRSAQRRIKRAPLVPLPIITEPFSRVAMDIVGPLPRCRSGNKYILVLCDYGTKYPEAIPLKSIDAEHIAEQLIGVFSRIGIPREILTDQGSNFTSQLLAELYRLLNIHPIVTSPYHPQTDGLVERFNQTLKSMLSRFSEEEGKNWDKMIPYILFAYREVPQATTGFSPFELLFGRNVRGPLDVLREQWESADKSDENVVSYVLKLRSRMAEMAEVVRQNMAEGQKRQKEWYDKEARLREFEVGDTVLVLLPTSTSKLLAKWQGPFQITKRMGLVNYQVDMLDRRKRFRIFHVNMLKEYHLRPPMHTNCFNDEEGTEEESEVPLWNDITKEEPKTGKHLTEAQQQELKVLLKKNSDLFSNSPGRTTLAEIHIETAMHIR